MRMIDTWHKMPFVWQGTAVLLLAAVLRLLWLGQMPLGLAQDEVLDADIVTAILEGQHALFFWQGYGHEPLYHYFNVPFRLALGDHWLAMRLPSAVTGLLLIALTMRWVRREWGAFVALTTAAFLALHWWPIIFSRIGIRPISEPVLLVLGAWFWPKRPWLAGLLWGLSLYTYTGARVVLALPLLLIPLTWLANYQLPITNYQLPITTSSQKFSKVRRTSKSASHLGDSAITRHLTFLTTATLTALPLFLTLALNPELQQRLDQLGGPLVALRAGDVRPVLGTIWATLGAFSWAGDPRWTYGYAGVTLLDGVTAVLFHLGLAVAIYRWREPRAMWVLVWLAITLLPSALSPDAPSTVRLVGALPVVFILPSLALAHFAPLLGQGYWAKAPKARLLLLVALPLALTLGRTAYWGFGMWPHTAEARQRYQTVWYEVAHHWQDAYQSGQTDAPPVMASGFFAPLDALTIRRTINQDPHTRWVQTGPGQAGALVLPASRGRESWLYVPEYAPIPAELWAAVHLQPEPFARGAGQPSFAIHTLAGGHIAPSQPQAVTFGGALTWLGYDVLPEQLITYWRVETAVPEDVKIFVHGLNQAGEIITQHDGWDAAPSTLWAGDVVVQRHPLPTAEPPVALRLGLYRFYSGERLPTAEGEEWVVIGLVDGN